VPDTTTQLFSHIQMQEFLFKGNPLPRLATDPEQMKKATGKVVLVASKEEVPGVYKALAAQMSGKARVLFGWVAAPGNPKTGFAADVKQQLQVGVCRGKPVAWSRPSNISLNVVSLLHAFSHVNVWVPHLH
jgi:hypothetical protein